MGYGSGLGYGGYKDRYEDPYTKACRQRREAEARARSAEKKLGLVKSVSELVNAGLLSQEDGWAALAKIEAV